MSRVKPKRILVVEDDPALARLVAGHLSRAGYEVRTEGRGEKALLCAAEHWPDLVILDLVLPDISGYEVCREIRRICRPWIVPVLMLTALDTRADKLRGYGHGADAYLTKPVSTDELIQAVATLLNGRGHSLLAGDV